MFDELAARETDSAPAPPHRPTLIPRRSRSVPTRSDHVSEPPLRPADRPAAVGARVGAYIIDCLLVNITLAIIAAVSGLLPISAEGLGETQAYAASVISAAVTLAYFATAEAMFGRTFGKRLLRCRVVTADEAPVALRAALIRRLPFLAGLLIPLLGPLLAFAVPLAALVTAIQDGPAGRGFHDRLADTKVVAP